MNFAIIKIQGHQEIINADTKNLVVDRMEEKVGSKILPTVLLTSIDGVVEVGTPSVSFPLELEVVEEQRGDKIYVAKFHAKSRFRKRIGFRAEQTVLKVVKFGSASAKSFGETKEKTEKTAKPKVAAKKKAPTVRKTVKKTV